MSPEVPSAHRAPRFGGVAFPVTLWTMVLSAREQAMPALTRLCEAYQRPVQAFFRQAGCPPDDVADLTQDFLRHLLRPDVLRTVDPAKGRFRSFLRACLQHHWSQAQARTRTLKAGGRVTLVPLDGEPEEPGLQVAHHGPSPDEAFDLAWARTLLGQAMNRLEQEAATPQRLNLVRHLLPALYATDSVETQAELAQRLGMKPGAVRTAIHRVRQRLGQLIREELAATVGDQADFEAELRELLAILSRS